MPLALRFEGAEPTFATLVRRYGGDVPPRAVLDELGRVGTVERPGRRVAEVLDARLHPADKRRRELRILAADVPYLIGTIDHNLQGLEPSRFQRKVMYDNLPLEAMDEFRAISSRHAQELIELLDHWLAQHDRDANPAVSGSGRVRAGVGVFSFEEVIEPQTERASKQPSARRSPALFAAGRRQMNQRKSPRAALLAACFGLIAACGGGTDGTGSPVPSAAGITTSGVMTKGSVIVNGVRFDDSAAIVTDDRGRTASGLANGMVVKLRGRRTDSGSGIAERIDVENELRAAIASINAASSPQSFVAAGITVLVEARRSSSTSPVSPR